MRIALSKKLHIPVLQIGSQAFALFDPRAWVLLSLVRRAGLILDDETTLAFSGLNDGCYLPPFSLENKTVLDVGAGCGETAWYFLKRKAKNVICIEKDPSRCAYIMLNKRNLNLNLEVINEAFSVRHVKDLDYDFIKIDIEGYEMEIIDVADRLKPTVIEAHNHWIVDQFKRKGFKVIRQFEPMQGRSIIANY